MIKNLFFIAVFAMFTFTASAQQSTFGVTAGYLNGELKVSEEGYNVSDDGSGFYVGVLLDLEISESFHIVPGVNYGRAEEANFIFVPVMAQYHIGDSGVFLQAGPQASFSLQDDPGDAVDTVGLDASFGLGYEFNSNFFVEAKYALGLTNRFSEKVSDYPGDLDLKLNTLTVGVGYKF